VITPTDITDALAMLTGNDSSKTPQPSELVIRAWMDHFGDRPTWTGDELAIAVHELCKRPRERMVQPADLGMIIAARRVDAFEREPVNTKLGRMDALSATKIAREVEPAPETEPTITRPGSNPLLVACSWCKAAPGNPCTTNGQRMRRDRRYHPSRLEAAR
jgi:hypothetical protein